MNSIRTPKVGRTTNSRRIAKAVDNESWQRFRLSLKGDSTKRKIARLRTYFVVTHSGHKGESCDVCICLDNYIKALCRGGQLKSGSSLQSLIRDNWQADVIK